MVQIPSLALGHRLRRSARVPEDPPGAVFPRKTPRRLRPGSPDSLDRDDLADGLPALVGFAAGDERVVRAVGDEPVRPALVVDALALERLLEELGHPDLDLDGRSTGERQPDGVRRDVVDALGLGVHAVGEGTGREKPLGGNRCPFAGGPRATPMSEDVDERAETVLRAARAGASVAESRFRGDLDVERKGGKTDVVTAADREAQRAVIDVVRETYPADAVVGEEEDALKAVPDEGATWIVDPIDGTNNYVRGTRIWTTSVAAVLDGEPVAAANVAPALGDAYIADGDGPRRNDEPLSVSAEDDPEAGTVCPTFWWAFDRRDEYAAACREAVERFGDIRRIGSAQLCLSMVAAGELDGAFTNLYTNPWDTVAGVHLVREAGGTVTDLHGERWRHDSEGIVASNGRVHDELLAATRGIGGD